MSKTLLLADDSVTIQKVVGISFANEDVRIVTVDNGDDAVTRAREIRPDIVLADVVMPGKSGYDVCAALKADPDLSGVPVLLLTGTFETFDEDRAARVGADGHITKPFEAQALVELVNERLAGRPPAGRPGRATASERPTAPVAEPEPFDFLEPEQTTLPRPRAGSAQRAGSGQRTAREEADDPFGFDALENDAPELETEAEEPQGAGNDATEARTTVLLEEPFAEEPSPEMETTPPVGFSARDFDGAELTSLLPAAEAAAGDDDEPAREVAAEELGDPLDGVFDPVLDDDEPPAALAAYDISSAETEDAFRTRVMAAVDASEAEEMAVQSVAQPLFDEELTGAEALDLRPAASAHELDLSPPPPAEDLDLPPARAAEPAGPPTAPPVAAAGEVAPALRGQVHETLEKVAWEAFGDLSERIVREAVERIEQVAWDVIPRLAETLIREEIRKLKGEE